MTSVSAHKSSMEEPQDNIHATTLQLWDTTLTHMIFLACTQHYEYVLTTYTVWDALHLLYSLTHAVSGYIGRLVSAAQSTVELKLLPKIDDAAFYLPFTLRGGEGSRNLPDISPVFTRLISAMVSIYWDRWQCHKVHTTFVPLFNWHFENNLSVWCGMFPRQKIYQRRAHATRLCLSS